MPALLSVVLNVSLRSNFEGKGAKGTELEGRKVMREEKRGPEKRKVKRAARREMTS